MPEQTYSIDEDLKEARAMASAIPAASLHIIPRAGHLTMLESPDAFNGALYAWLSDQYK